MNGFGDHPQILQLVSEVREELWISNFIVNIKSGIHQNDTDSLKLVVGKKEEKMTRVMNLWFLDDYLLNGGMELQLWLSEVKVTNRT